MCRAHGNDLGHTTGDDVLLGTPGKDVIVAGRGDDLIRGYQGRDVVLRRAWR